MTTVLEAGKVNSTKISPIIVTCDTCNSVLKVDVKDIDTDPNGMNHVMGMVSPSEVYCPICKEKRLFTKGNKRVGKIVSWIFLSTMIVLLILNVIFKPFN